MENLKIIIIAFITFVSFAQISFSGERIYKTIPETLRSGGLEFRLDSSYFSSDSIYDYSGSKTDIESGKSFSKIDIELTGRYGHTASLEFRGGLRGRRNHSYFEGNGGHDLYSDGLESYFLGAKYFIGGPTASKFALDLQVRQTVYSNSDSSSGQVSDTEMILGDDGIEVNISASLGYRSGGFSLSALVGYNRPANNLSDEVLYKGEMAYAFFNNFALYGGVKGVSSMSNDPYSDDTVSKPYMNQGISHLYNSIDREYIAPYFGFNFNLTSFVLAIQGGYYLAGVSTDGGYEGKVSVIFGRDGVTPYKKKIGSFKDYDVAANVIKVSSREVFVKIDKGVSDSIEKGMKVDIYKSDHFGTNILIASGYIYETKPSYSIIKVQVKYRKKIKIQNGFIARGYLE